MISRIVDTMDGKATDDIFEITCLLRNIDVKLCARSESGVKQILALVTSDGDIVLHYTYGEMPSVVKRIPWFSDRHKVIQAVCFDPSATWLLVVAVDGSLYIIPALNLVDKRQKIDCKWTLSDVTYFAKHYQTPKAQPTSVVWWQTLDSNQNALVGFESGSIVVISLTDGRCLGSCSISESVSQLNLCQDNTLDTVSLLINGNSGQQWRLILEHHSKGYSWPPDLSNPSDESTRSRLHNLKQMGVEKLASLKQRLSDARGNRRDSQTSDTASESSHSESNHSEPELLPHLCDTIFAPQFARNRYLFSAYYKPASLLTVHAVNVESAPLYVHKLPPKTASLLLTDRFIYTVNNESNTVSVVSSHFSECRLDGDSEFNEDSLIAQFTIEDETILQVYKMLDVAAVLARKNRDDFRYEKPYQLPKTIEELNLRKIRIDTCVIVTNNSVYKIHIKNSPTNKFIRYITEDRDMRIAERLGNVFAMNTHMLLECCGDLMIGRGSYHWGIILYKTGRVHFLKRILKLAIATDCRTLLKFIHLCLSTCKMDMSTSTVIHTGNLGVMAYIELILRNRGQSRTTTINDFLTFLAREDYYDQILAVNIACQSFQWNLLSLLAKARGLQPEVVSAFGQILQTARGPLATEKDFLIALSEPCLTQSLLLKSKGSQVIFKFIRTNIDVFPVDILQRFFLQLDPSQPCAIPFINRLLHNNRYASSLDTTIESIDLDFPDSTVVTIKDFVDTFMHVAIYLSKKTDKSVFDLVLLKNVELPIKEDGESPLQKLPDLHPLSCGYEHAAIVRNHDLYTMGVSNSGCLGLGTFLCQTSAPKLVKGLNAIKVKALSVSCGRKHTLVLTDYGVYAFGSNTYGQLGIDRYVAETSTPQILPALSMEKIVDIAAGQYHSLALTSTGKVYSWGWGIHGQLGHGLCDNEYYPKLLNFPHLVKQVTAGHAHSLILTCEGKLFGFGSNVFGQLESCQIESNKSSRPVWVLLMPDIYTPIEKVATAYFHNIAIRADQEVYTWGASPQEVRLFQSKSNQKQNGLSLKPPDSWKASVHVYSSGDKRPIEQVAVGYRHSAILHNGKILWGKNKDDELSPPKLRDQDNLNSLFTQRFLHISCGLDYTMAIDHTGKLLAWGSMNVKQTLLGKQVDDDTRKSNGKLMISKNTKRVIKLPSSLQGSSDKFPLEVPGVPSMAISFNLNDHKLLFSRKFNPFALRQIENDNFSDEGYYGKNCSLLDYIEAFPDVKCGHKTLHYALETYFGLYDTDSIMRKCLEVYNYQAASKVAMLDGHYGDSLSFQLVAFKKHLQSLNLDLQSMFANKDLLDVKEKDQGFVELVVKNMQDDLNERNLLHSTSGDKISSCNSPARILSSSSSLDSIRQWGDDVEHQGGCESPCDVSSEMGDIRQNITQYVQSLQSNESSPPITSVSKMVSEIGNIQTKVTNGEAGLQIKDKTAKEIIDAASDLVEFYIKKIYLSENHILMQNILMKCIEFWLTNNLPVPVLEDVLLKNLDKYFYPLSILLFCKNFGSSSEEEDEMVKNESDMRPNSSSGFLKEFSTKFCLQLCSMVLENVNKS